MSGSVAHVLRHLLSMRGDDPKLARLAAAAVLVAREGRTATSLAGGWSTEEMDHMREEVRRLESAWRCHLAASGPLDEDGGLAAVALHLAYREMEAAVTDGAPLPSHEELLLRVARELLGRAFVSAGEVEVAVASILLPSGAGPLPPPGHVGTARLAEEALACLAVRAAKAPPRRASSTPRLNNPLAALNMGGLARAGALVGAMLGGDFGPGADELMGAPPPGPSGACAFGHSAAASPHAAAVPMAPSLAGPRAAVTC